MKLRFLNDLMKHWSKLPVPVNYFLVKALLACGSKDHYGDALEAARKNVNLETIKMLEAT